MSDNTTPIRFNPGKSGYYSDDSKTKPTGSAGGKDFGKVMSQGDRESGGKSGKKQVKADDDVAEELTDDIALLEEEVVPQGPVSLFDMSKVQAKPTKPLAKAEKNQSSADADKGTGLVAEKKSDANSAIDADDHIPVDPDHIGDAAKTQKKLETATRPFDLLASASHDMSPHTEKTLAKKEKPPVQFGYEQPDLAAVNPMAAIPPSNEINLALNLNAEQPLPPVKSIQELINLMVKEAQSIEAEGKTDTTITIKHPPIFEGAQLVVTSFDNAKREFNVAFENLTQAAQQLINREDNRASLLLALEQKGYQVHILTATTIDEHRIFTAKAEDPRRDRDQSQDGDRRGSQGRQQNRDGKEGAGGTV